MKWGIQMPAVLLTAILLLTGCGHTTQLPAAQSLDALLEEYQVPPDNVIDRREQGTVIPDEADQYEPVATVLEHTDRRLKVRIAQSYPNGDSSVITVLNGQPVEERWNRREGESTYTFYSEDGEKTETIVGRHSAEAYKEEAAVLLEQAFGVDVQQYEPVYENGTVKYYAKDGMQLSQSGGAVVGALTQAQYEVSWRADEKTIAQIVDCTQPRQAASLIPVGTYPNNIIDDAKAFLTQLGLDPAADKVTIYGYQNRFAVVRKHEDGGYSNLVFTADGGRLLEYRWLSWDTDIHSYYANQLHARIVG